MNEHEVNARVGPKPDRHRVGRGPGSGWGCTAGRGNNGACARSGHKRKLYREGGQMPFVRRIPKLGFNNAEFRREWAFINLSALNEFADGDTVTPEECLKRGLIPKMRSGLKILGVGALERKLTIRAHRVSEAARAAIVEKGGTIELLQAAGDQSKRAWQKKRGKGKATVRREAAEQRAKQKR